MIRALTSCLWIIAALALGFEAVAQPCDLRMQMEQETAHEMHADMPCHDGMAVQADHSEPTPNHAPDHERQACCCAALLGNAMTVSAPELGQPAFGVTLWAIPMPDNANSILLEYEPPPPRA